MEGLDDFSEMGIGKSEIRIAKSEIRNQSEIRRTESDQSVRTGSDDAKRDWGYAKEYVEAMWLMLQQERPDDYVIATGETHSVREFLEAAFTYAGLDWHQYVGTDERYLRPAEVDLLVGDARKARQRLGWQPRVTFRELARLMVEADRAALPR